MYNVNLSTVVSWSSSTLSQQTVGLYSNVEARYILKFSLPAGHVCKSFESQMKFSICFCSEQAERVVIQCWSLSIRKMKYESSNIVFHHSQNPFSTTWSTICSNLFWQF